jgi:hypothetical protein
MEAGMKPIGILATLFVVLGCLAAVARADTNPYHYWNRPWAEAMILRNQLKPVVSVGGVILDARCGGVGTMLRSSIGVKTYRNFSCRFLWKIPGRPVGWTGYAGIHVTGSTTFSAMLN